MILLLLTKLNTSCRTNNYLFFSTCSIPQIGSKWLQVNPVTLNFDYLHIAGPGNFKTKASPNFGQRIFWQSINFNENWVNQLRPL